MGSNVQYSVNIAMEATIMLVLLIMLITLFWQKKLLVTTIPLIFLSVAIALLIIVQIVTWTMMLYNVPAVYGEMPMRIVFVLDYVFSYGASVAFYYYIEALAMDGYNRIGVACNPSPIVKHIIVIWGIITTVVYAAMLFIPSVYHLEAGQPVYSIPAYIGLHIMAKFACVCALIFVIRHRDVIGKNGTFLSFLFIILISILFVLDEIYDLCVGHVLMALVAFMLYVSIDLHKGLLLERKEKEIMEWKTQIMLSQMQPHFLYNVLSTISSMCEIQNANEARDVVNHFADYFRMNMESLGKEKTLSFDKELEHIRTYLWLEKVRFEDALNICYEIGTTDFELPSLTVQPIVENAVKHGILPKEDGGTVVIRTYETSLDYVITVEDDGVGFDVKEKLKDSNPHIGIENVSKRLEIICNGTCEIESEIGKGTVVMIHIPKGERL